MILARLGDAAIVISVIFASAFVIGYAAMAPWYRSEIGRSLFLSKSWTAGIAWLAFFRTTLGWGEEYSAVNWFRAALWISFPFIATYTFWALLWKGQMRRRIRERKEHQDV